MVGPLDPVGPDLIGGGAAPGLPGHKPVILRSSVGIAVIGGGHGVGGIPLPGTRLHQIGHHPKDRLAAGHGGHVRPPLEIEMRQGPGEQGRHQGPVEQPGQDRPAQGIEHRPAAGPQGEISGFLQVRQRRRGQGQGIEQQDHHQGQPQRHQALLGHGPGLEQADAVLRHGGDPAQRHPQGDEGIERQHAQPAIGPVAKGAEDTEFPLAAEDEGHRRGDQRRRGQEQHRQQEHQDGQADHPRFSAPQAKPAQALGISPRLRPRIAIECGAIEARRQGREHQGRPGRPTRDQGHAQIPRDRAMLAKEHHRRSEDGQREDEPRIPPGRQTEVQRPLETGHPGRPG